MEDDAALLDWLETLDRFYSVALLTEYAPCSFAFKGRHWPPATSIHIYITAVTQSHTLFPLDGKITHKYY